MENNQVNKKLSVTSENFFRKNNEINNERQYIQNYNNPLKAQDYNNDNKTNKNPNPNQSPKIQSGKLRENHQNISKNKKIIFLYT